MMTNIAITGFFFCQVFVLIRGEKVDSKFSEKVKEREVLEASESRYRQIPDYPDRDFSGYNNRFSRKEIDVSVTLKAPHHEAPDHWRNEPEYSDRRTFFEDFIYNFRDKTTAFPSFHQLMTSVFGGKEEYLHNPNRATPPYSFDPRFNFRPTEPNYIPPPKPIRASVIKLETITRSPNYPSFEFETTTKFYPHAGTILNHVLIENSKRQQIKDFYFQEPEAKIPHISPFPVLPKPGFVAPTTLKPNYSKYSNHYSRSIYKHQNNTDYKYPESVQDQLPHLNLADVKIPYETENPVPQIFTTTREELPPESLSGYRKNLFFPPSSLGLVDVRGVDSIGTNAVRKERPNGNPVGIKFEFDTTTIRSFPGAVEKVKRPAFKYTTKLRAQLDKSPVERVTNLTVEGFSNNEKNVFHTPKGVDYLKVRDLINYEMDRLGNVSLRVLAAEKTSINDSSMRGVNLNDELSLDAKILKDTNWDGLTVLPISTTEEPKEATTELLIPNTKPKKEQNKTAFWEIAQEPSTVFPTNLEFTTEATITEQSKIQTTTELSFFSSTLETTETNEPTTTEETTTKRIFVEPERRLIFNRDDLKSVPELSESTTSPGRTVFRRRYSRRPKIVNFTPYPTAEELQKKTVNRNHFPKRQKPNITLSFGNKNVVTKRPTFGTDEVMKYSDEDVRKRRKIGKRRHVFKKLRTTTPERQSQHE